jgi:outer membrane protein
VHAELVLALLLLAACDPVRVLTRPEGDGGWGAERRQSEMATRAERARVDLAAEPVATVDRALDLADVVRMTAAESRRIAEADQDLAIAGERVKDARGRYFPAISGQGRYNWYDSAQATRVHFPPGLLPAGVVPPVVVVREREFGTVNGTATMPIDLFGEITKSLTATQAGYRAEAARHYATVLSEETAAVRAYFDLLEAERLRNVVRESLAANRQQLENAQQKFDAGRVTKNELLVVQVTVRNDEQALLQNDLEVSRARWALNQLIGRPIDAPTRLVDVQARPAVPDAPAALREAYTHNPVLASLVEEQQRLEDTVSAIQRSRFPQLQGGGTVDYSSSTIVQPQRVGGAFVGFNWNFDLGGRKDSQVEQARLAAEQNRIRIEASLRELESAVRATQLAVEERLAALATAQAAVAQAEENARIRKQQFDAGRATSNDVLDAQALLTAQRAGEAQALYQAQARRAELQQVMGLPLEAILPGETR